MKGDKKRTNVLAAERRERLSRAYSFLLDTVQGIELTEGGEAELLVEQVQQLADIESAIRWAIGDLLAEYKQEHGAMKAYRAGAMGLGKSQRWAIELCRIAEIYPAAYRLAGVEWHRYREVSSTEDPYQEIVNIVTERLEQEVSNDEAKAA